MNLTVDRQMVWLGEGVVGGLIAASLVGFFLARRAKSESARTTVENLNARIRAWWIMIGVFALALLVGLCVHAAAVLDFVRALVWNGQHHDSGLRVSVHSPAPGALA